MLSNIHNKNRDGRRAASSIDNTKEYRDKYPELLERVSTTTLAGQLAVGDVVFIHVRALPFLKVAQTTASWSNHVGIVVETHGAEPRIAESAFPIVKTTSLSRFITRSAHGRVAVRRLVDLPSIEQQLAIRHAALRRLGIFYDTGFNLHSRKQFCSRFVREVLAEATGYEVGEIETFSDFLVRNPQADLVFWRLWYFGKIPWQRQTVTPASLLNSPALMSVFDGYVEKERSLLSVLRCH